MLDLFGNDTPIAAPNQPVNRNKDGSWKFNPMTLQHGETEGEKCKDCRHLVSKRYSKTYYKCALRNNVEVRSPQSDHRVNWVACGKFEKQEAEASTK